MRIKMVELKKEKKLKKSKVNKNNEKYCEQLIKKSEITVLRERFINDIEELMSILYPKFRKGIKLVQCKELDNEFFTSIRNALEKHISPESKDISNVIYKAIRELLKNYNFSWEKKFIVDKD